MGYLYLFLLRRWQAETKWRVVYEDVGDLLLLVADRHDAPARLFTGVQRHRRRRSRA